MHKDNKIYDKNGVLLKEGDKLNDGGTIRSFWDEWYITGNKDMWKVEEFTLELFKYGFRLVDFEKENE